MGTSRDVGRAAPTGRRRRGVAFVVLIAAGCQRHQVVDDACTDSFPGERFLDGTSPDVMLRVNCYRRFVGLSQARVTRLAQDAAVNHARYLELNGVLDPASPNYARTLSELFIEDAGLPGFTGATAFDRLEATQAYDPSDSVGVWDVLLGDLEVLVDELIADPYLRDVFFQPLWLGAGIAAFDADVQTRSMYMNLLYGFPPNTRIFRPVVYPADGQLEVPTWWRSTRGDLDPLYVEGDRIGFPITVTVGADAIAGGSNPYALTVADASLTGPEGDVPLEIVLPNVFPWGSLQATAIFAPSVPLLPGGDYAFRAELDWISGSRKVDVTFTTTLDPAPWGG